jgi:hypothetical protein
MPATLVGAYRRPEGNTLLRWALVAWTTDRSWVRKSTKVVSTAAMVSMEAMANTASTEVGSMGLQELLQQK